MSISIDLRFFMLTHRNYWLKMTNIIVSWTQPIKLSILPMK